MFLVACPVVFAESGSEDFRRQVEAVERAFAQTMADRDHEAFMGFLSEEAIFISGPAALRGKQEVAEKWKVFFEGPDAPFSWEPETVEVLESGELALSSGPVHDAIGKLTATFTSVWRQEEPGVWRIILDKGNRVCPPASEPPDEPADN
jgi:ketosteroid isomerase-like protein